MEQTRTFLKNNHNTLKFFFINTTFCSSIILILHCTKLFDLPNLLAYNYLIIFLIILSTTYLLSFYEVKNFKTDTIVQKYSNLTFLVTISLLTLFPLPISSIKNILIILCVLSALLSIYFTNQKTENKTNLIKPLLIFITIFFVLTKIAIPMIYQGNFIDEYLHILSGIEFFKSWELPELHYKTQYTRGTLVSISLGLLMSIFGQTLFVVKMLPATLGIASFFLLYKISKQIFTNQNYTLLLLLTYTVAPWFIFNHFYARMYVFYEFFLLLLTFLFFKIIESSRKTKIFVTYLTITSAILAIIYFFMNDSGLYMILLYAFLFLTYIFFFETQKLEIKSNFFKNHKLKFTIFLLTTIILTQVFNLVDMFDKIMTGTIAYTSGLNFKYDNLFFNLNIFFSVFFLTTPILLLKKSVNKYSKITIVSALILFLIHYNASLDLQITRGIVYFLPIFFLVSILGLEKVCENLKNKNSIFGLILLALISFTGMYPENFFSDGPHLPTDVNYRRYKEASLKTQELINESTVIITNFPHAYKFNNPGIKNEIYFLRDSELSFTNTGEYAQRYKGEDGFYYYTLSNDKMISNTEIFQDVVNQNDTVIIVDKGPFYLWTTQEIQNLIQKNFKETEIFPSFVIYEEK